MAPSMPIRLIEARAVVGVDDAAAAAAPVWGISAVKADTSPFTGAGVTVCVLDTGIDAGHVAFQGVNVVQMDFTARAIATSQGTAPVAPARSSAPRSQRQADRN